MRRLACFAHAPYPDVRPDAAVTLFAAMARTSSAVSVSSSIGARVSA
jgi:hypothetical protein